MFWNLFIAAKKKEVQEEETDGRERRVKTQRHLFSLRELLRQPVKKCICA